MKDIFYKLVFSAIVIVATTACSQEADVVSRNLSVEADNFKVLRRVVFYNGVTGEYILQVEGYCSLGNQDTPLRMSVTCRNGNGEYVKHFLGLSDNVTFFAEQISGVKASQNHYKVIFRPSTILPVVELN